MPGRVGRPCQTQSGLLAYHFINAPSPDGIISLIDDELQFLKATDENSFAGWISVYGCVEQNVVTLKLGPREVHVKEFHRLNLLKVVPVYRSVHQ